MIDVFVQNYQQFNEKEKEQFACITSRLLNVNYMTKYKPEDSGNYYFIASHYECFKAYFSFMQMELSLYPQTKTVVLKSEHINKFSLDKLQSFLFLILRLLYHQKLKEISLSNQIVVTVEEIRNKYENIGIFEEEKLNTAKLKDCIKILKKYNLVYYKGQNIQNDDFEIIIYPTIQYAYPAETIKELEQKINSYKRGEENEEIDEDTVN